MAALHGLGLRAGPDLDRSDGLAERLRERAWLEVADLVALAAGFAVLWALAVGVLWLQGAGPAAFEDIVTLWLGAGDDQGRPTPIAPSKLVRWFDGQRRPRGQAPPAVRPDDDYLVWWGTGSWPLWLAAVPATAWLLLGRRADVVSRRLVGRPGRSRPGSRSLLPGLFWQHYYLLPTPGVALAVAVALADAGPDRRVARDRSASGRLLVGSIVGLACCASVAWTVRLQVRDYLLVPPEELTSPIQGGPAMGRPPRAGPRARPAVEGLGRPAPLRLGLAEPALHLFGARRPTRHFFADPLLKDYSKGYHRDHPLVRPGSSEIMRDLEARPPALIFGGVSAVPRARASSSDTTDIQT